MNTKIVLWTARTLSVLYILFIFLFSFDVFEGTQPLWNKIGGFIIHNIPVILLVLLMIITWKRPLAAGIVFIIAGICSIFFFQAVMQGVIIFMSVSLPIILCGCLYIIAWYLKRKDAAGNKSADAAKAGDTE